jgi:hypothetical protein
MTGIKAIPQGGTIFSGEHYDKTRNTKAAKGFVLAMSGVLQAI